MSSNPSLLDWFQSLFEDEEILDPEIRAQEHRNFNFECKTLTLEQAEQKSIEAQANCLTEFEALNKCSQQIWFNWCSKERSVFINCYRKHRGFLRTKEEFMAAKRQMEKNADVAESHSELIDNIIQHKDAQIAHVETLRQHYDNKQTPS